MWAKVGVGPPAEEAPANRQVSEPSMEGRYPPRWGFTLRGNARALAPLGKPFSVAKGNIGGSRHLHHHSCISLPARGQCASKPAPGPWRQHPGQTREKCVSSAPHPVRAPKGVWCAGIGGVRAGAAGSSDMCSCVGSRPPSPCCWEWIHDSWAGQVLS